MVPGPVTVKRMRRSRLKRIQTVTNCVFAILPGAGLAGEISGLPPHLSPTTRPDYTFYLGNDFLVPGTNDDFRTQQIISSARLANRWRVVADHSILTRADAIAGPPARIDIMSLSLGLEVIDRDLPRGRSTLVLGTGIRGVGNFEGSRIQNGFHSLVSSGTSLLPYASTRQADATVWVLGDRHRLMRLADDPDRWFGWDTGYWVRAGALATADGQFDGVAGLYAIATRPGIDVWLGVRRDWREGYKADIVQAETAKEERKTALAIGFRLGPLVLEMVNRPGSDASYGQLSFVSSAETRRGGAPQTSDVDVQLGLHVPQMLFQLAGRRDRRFVTHADSAWRESVYLDLRGGQPQYGRDVTRFVETGQLTGGIEFSRALPGAPNWLRLFTHVGVGWRRERLVGQGDLDGVRSGWIGRGVLEAGVGFDIDSTAIGEHWRHRLRIGIAGWAPTESVTTSAGARSTELLRPGASIAFALVFGRR